MSSAELEAKWLQRVAYLHAESARLNLARSFFAFPRHRRAYETMAKGYQMESANASAMARKMMGMPY